MNRESCMRRVGSVVGGTLFLVVFLSPCGDAGRAEAQTLTIRNETSTVDAYGNARPYYRTRRSVGWYQSESQRTALRGYQNGGRRADRRGGGTLFNLPGDSLSLRSMWSPSVRRPPDPLHPATASPFRKRISQLYGGFGRRLRPTEPGDLSELLVRRSGLIEATSLNAPVRRAFLDNRVALGFQASLERTPYVRRESPAPREESVAGIRLDQRLREGADQAVERVRSEGWAWFRQGEYWRAARAFESAALLRPVDTESRIGELFCYLSLGATRTAMATLYALHRRDPGLFSHPITMRTAYGDAAEARQLPIRLRLQVNANPDNPDLRALYALALWYLAERDEAIVVAANLSDDHPGAVYGDWPARMQAARKALATENEQPQN